MELKENLELVFGESIGRTCGSGGYTPVWIEDRTTGEVVWSGETCICGRGCGNRDCVRDDWEHHDTDIEQFRADCEEEVKR